MPITNLNEKGFAFTADVTTALFVVFVTLGLSVVHLISSVDATGRELEQFSINRKLLSFADNFVKNSSPQNPFYGTALYDETKKRVVSNKLSNDLLASLTFQKFPKPFMGDSVHLARIYLYNRDGFVNDLFSDKISANCSAIERFVLIGNRKAKLGVVLCEN